MILHQLIHRPINCLFGTALSLRSLRSVHLGHEGMPIRLYDLRGAVIHELLNEAQHSCAEGPHAPFPQLQILVPWPGLVRPGYDFIVIFPTISEEGLEMPHGEEVAEKDLVADNGFAADDEGNGEWNGVFEL